MLGSNFTVTGQLEGCISHVSNSFKEKPRDPSQSRIGFQGDRLVSKDGFVGDVTAALVVRRGGHFSQKFKTDCYRLRNSDSGGGRVGRLLAGAPLRKFAPGGDLVNNYET
jgi:hypothetical protein